MPKVFDSERFIVEMHAREIIWNNKIVQTGKNKKLRQKAWIELGEIFCDDWDSLQDKSKYKRINELRKKWKGLRDYYNREKNRTYIGKKRDRETPILDMLNFLQGIVTKPDTETNIEANEVPVIFSPEHDSDVSEANYYPNAKKSKNEELVKSSDPDMSFLLTILPDMKSMTQSQNFEFRFEVMKAIKKIKYNEAESYRFENTSSNVYSPTHVNVQICEDIKPNIVCEDDHSDGSY